MPCDISYTLLTFISYFKSFNTPFSGTVPLSRANKEIMSLVGVFFFSNSDGESPDPDRGSAGLKTALAPPRIYPET